MTSIQERIKSLADEQRKAWEVDGKPLADIAAERALTADEHTKFEKLTRAFDDYDDRISLLVQQRDIEERAVSFAAELLDNPGAFGAAADVKRFADQIRAALSDSRTPFDYVSNINESRAISTREGAATLMRALSIGTASAGGNAVGQTFLAQLIEPLRQFSGVYAAGAYVLTTSKGESIALPRLASFGAGAAATEATTLTGTDPSFNQVTFGTKKYGDYRGASNELIQDALFDIEGLIIRLMGENIGILLGQDLITGSGTGAPQGIATASTLGVTGSTAVGGAPSWDNLIDLQESVLAPYQPKSAWVASNSVVGGIRKLKDTSGRYLWEPNGQAGQASTLLGAPLFRDPFVAAQGLSAKSLFYGDFSRYWVRVVGETRIERSDQALFGSDQTAFRAVLRADGRLMDASAVKHFIGGAS